jgi:hypothetical protein
MKFLAHLPLSFVKFYPTSDATFMFTLDTGVEDAPVVVTCDGQPLARSEQAYEFLSALDNSDDGFERLHESGLTLTDEQFDAFARYMGAE